MGHVEPFHTGGLNACLCDGSVRVISESIPIRTVARLVTAWGGEIISDFDKVAAGFGVRRLA